MAGGSRRAAAVCPRIEIIDWEKAFDFGHPGSVPRRGASSRRHHPWVEVKEFTSRGDHAVRRRHRAVPERRPSVHAAAAQEDEREGSSASAAKKSRKLDTEKEDALLHMLGEINKSLQASSKSAETPQSPKDTSPEEIFEALVGIPRLARADRLRAYSMLIRDDRRFRSLMALPKNMRKEWLLMEIGRI